MAVAGDNMKWTYQGSGTHHVEIKDHNNAVPSMTVEVNGVLYDWVPANGHLLAQTGQGSDGWTWTKSETLTFPSAGSPGNFGSFLTGVLDLTGQSPPLFIVSPTMTAFGTSQGPLGEHTIMRCICPNDASYGGSVGTSSTRCKMNKTISSVEEARSRLSGFS